MQLVDLSKTEKRIDSRYLSIPQPMVIYHNEEELDTSEENPVKLYTWGQYYDWIADEFGPHIPIKLELHKEFERPVFIKTEDKFVPDYQEISPSIRIIYKTDQNGNKIPTEGCWIRVYIVDAFRIPHRLLTSSGIWMAAKQINYLTAAISAYTVKTQIKLQYSTIREGGIENKIRRRTADHILRKRYATPGLVRAFHLTLNPLSPSFMNFEKSLKTALRGRINSKEAKKLVDSEKIMRLFFMEIKYVIPELVQAVRNKVPPEKVAAAVEKVLDKALEGETSKEAMERIKDIVAIAYNDPVADKRATNVPLLEKNQMYEPEQIKEISPEKENEIRKELNYPDSYIMDDLPEDIENFVENNGEN